MNYAVMLSGGVGQRVGGDIPKQYIKIKGHMIITYALISIMKSEFVDVVQIVADEHWHKEIVDDIKSMGLDDSKVRGFTEPGENRQLSILNGMVSIINDRYGKGEKLVPSGMARSSFVSKEVESRIAADDTIFIHDAARPFLSEKMIERCYVALGEHEGVMPVLPMKDTVYLSEDGFKVSKLLKRSQVYSGQAPELFNLKKYYRANINLFPDDIIHIHGSTEPAIKAGMDVAMIEGDEGNFKVTTKADLLRCQEIIINEGMGVK